MSDKRKWSQIPEEEIARYRKNVCLKCFYFSSITRKAGVNNWKDTCDYILIEGHTRPCRFFECQTAGVFKPWMGSNKKNVLRIKHG